MTLIRRACTAILDRQAAVGPVCRLRWCTELVEQGAPGEELFLLFDGVLAVERNGEPIAEVGPGAILGEMALLEGGRRTATLRARRRAWSQSSPATASTTAGSSSWPRAASRNPTVRAPPDKDPRRSSLATEDDLAAPAGDLAARPDRARLPGRRRGSRGAGQACLDADHPPDGNETGSPIRVRSTIRSTILR